MGWSSRSKICAQGKLSSRQCDWVDEVRLVMVELERCARRPRRAQDMRVCDWMGGRTSKRSFISGLSIARVLIGIRGIHMAVQLSQHPARAGWGKQIRARASRFAFLPRHKEPESPTSNNFTLDLYSNPAPWWARSLQLNIAHLLR